MVGEIWDFCVSIRRICAIAVELFCSYQFLVFFTALSYLISTPIFAISLLALSIRVYVDWTYYRQGMEPLQAEITRLQGEIARLAPEANRVDGLLRQTAELRAGLEPLNAEVERLRQQVARLLPEANRVGGLVQRVAELQAAADLQEPFARLQEGVDALRQEYSAGNYAELATEMAATYNALSGALQGHRATLQAISSPSQHGQYRTAMDGLLFSVESTIEAARQNALGEAATAKALQALFDHSKQGVL